MAGWSDHIIVEMGIAVEMACNVCLGSKMLKLILRGHCGHIKDGMICNMKYWHFPS